MALDGAVTALDLVPSQAARRDHGYCYPGFIAVRGLRRSRAFMAFTRFDRTCTIELSSLGGAPGTSALHERVRESLDRSRMT